MLSEVLSMLEEINLYEEVYFTSEKVIEGLHRSLMKFPLRYSQACSTRACFMIQSVMTYTQLLGTTDISSTK